MGASVVMPFKATMLHRTIQPPTQVHTQSAVDFGGVPGIQGNNAMSSSQYRVAIDKIH